MEPQIKHSPTGPSCPSPSHVAIIMDGNGRWARARGKPRVMGHREGAKAARRVVEASIEFGVNYLTLFGFSSENWSRPAEEVGDLMKLLEHYLAREIGELHEQGVCFRVIGDRGRLPPEIVGLIAKAENLTLGNDRLTLTLALSYGGRRALVAAARTLGAQCKAGIIEPEDIDETLFGATLQVGNTPAPDLLIRTSGEQRISNFMLWECAYSEFVFSDILWPDFSREDYLAAITEFARRERRYGIVGLS